MNKTTTCAVFIVFMVLLIAEPAACSRAAGDAGMIEPQLSLILDRCTPDSVVTVIFELEGGVQAGAVGSEFRSAALNRKNSHRVLMEKMQLENGKVQQDLVDRFSDVAGSGAIKRIRLFWITNLIVLDVEAQQVARLASLPGVKRVVENRTIYLKGYKSEPAHGKAGVEGNLWKVKAPYLWLDGYTGEGVLVCLIDSGVDGTHPALSTKWRGNNVPGSAACWHDPYNFTSSPIDDDVTIGPTHGTSVTGILVGSAGSDTIGIAPGAQWIAANAFEGSSQTSSYEVIIDCLEWAADPDGDPSTVSDVPDVINNSWGTNDAGGTGLCDDVLWSAMDAVEALGSMLFFAAGNYGSGAQTISSPASRITTDINSFAVGATDEYDRIASFSSRGPSTCDSITVKPEVVAPGVDIRSSRGVGAGGGYQYSSGTSFSTPHASGVAGLLRQVSATSQANEIKRAILNSAGDLGDTGDDNDYGMGLVDANAAAKLLGTPESPVIRLLGVSPSPLVFTPDDTIQITAELYNMGLSVSGVQVDINDLSGLIEVIDGTSSVGTISAHQKSNNSSDPFLLYTRKSAPRGSEVLLELTVSSTDYNEKYRLMVPVGEETTGAYADHSAGNVVMTVTNFGQYGYFNGSDLVGSGFRYPADGKNWLFSAFFLAGTGRDRVSDGLGGLDTDWVPAEGGNLTILRSGGRADEEGRARFDDSATETPLPLLVYQRSYAYSDPEIDDFIILHFLMKNEGTGVLDSLYAGLYFDWDVDQYSYSSNEVGWIDSLSLGYMFGSGFEEHLGLSLITGPPASHRAIEVNEELYDPFGNFAFTDSKKWNFLTAGFDQAVSTKTADWAHMLSAGPLTIDPGDSLEVAFSVIAGSGLTDLIGNAIQVREVWDRLESDPPPVFVISILPDPLLTEYLKLSTVPSEALTGIPLIMVDGDTLSVDTITSGEVEIYSADYTVQTEGDHLVTVRGTDQGGATGTSTEWFTALSVGPEAGGEMWTSDGKFKFSLPAGAVDFEGYLYLAPCRSSVPTLPDGMVPISSPYSILPSGLELRSPATVSCRWENTPGQVSEESLVLLLLTGDRWETIALDNLGNGEISAALSRSGTFLIAEGAGAPGVPETYLLSQNFPNPFNPQTTISFDVPDGEGAVPVKIEIFNLRGQLVKTLLDGEKTPGKYELVWDGRDSRGDDVSSGIYLYTMKVDGFNQTRKMVLLK